MKDVSNVNLWMDSTDIALEGKRSISRKSSEWSYKCDSPRREYMILSDGNGSVKKLWGGYSPKIYDGTWLELYKAWLEENLKGGVVVADNHFFWGKKHLKGVKFHSNYCEKKSDLLDSDDGQDLSLLSNNFI